jgi:hypothetical protein
VQLSQLIETSETINGTYRVVGADEAQLTGLLTSLEPLSHQSAESMVAGLGGRHSDAGLAEIILLAFLIAASLLLLFLLIFEAVRSSPVLGVHLLLGKSTGGFAVSLFRPVLLSAVFTAVLSVLLTLLLMPGYDVNPPLAVAALSSAAAGCAVAFFCTLAGAAVLLSIKPVDAILGRYSKKILIGVISNFYLLSIAGFSVAFVALDAPIKEVDTLTDVSRSWAAFNNQQILYRQTAGNDQASFTGQSSQHSRDFHEWYSSIADEPGVTLVNTEHYDRPVLDRWRGVYASVPEKPFWYVVASPSYLSSQGFDIDPDLVSRAATGERVFLLPNTWAESAKQEMRGWLDENSHIDYDPSIVTEYLKKPVVTFEEYSPTTPLFMWNVDPTLPQRASDPVILILTPQNMIPFESESLFAVGLDNSYIKLSTAAARSYTSAQYLAQFNLDDNEPEFLPVSQFIAGLKKTIQDFLALFGTVAIFLCVFCLIMLTTLLKLFSTTYREALAVKRMLGYSLIRLFAPAIAVTGVAGAGAVVAVIVVQSTSAILANITMIVVQALMIALLTRRYSRLQLSSALKE